MIAYVSQPWPGRFAFAGGDLKEDLLNLRRDFAALAAADLNPINRTNRRDFSRGAAEKNFVSDINRRALNRALPAAELLQVSASIDASAFIFEYLFGVYIQVYLIAVCFAWIRGLSFEEGELFRFGMRRFSYVLEWAGLVVLVSTLIVRLPLLL